MNTPTDLDPELRCAEYALGVLDAAARRALEQSASVDPAVAKMLLRWQQRFSPLAEDVPRVEPSPRVWTRIKHDLGFIQAPSPRLDARSGGWWSNLNLWRTIGIGASVTAVALLAVNVVWQRAAPAPERVAAVNSYMVATIARSDGVAHWTATIDIRGAHMVVVPAVKLTVADNRSTELWLILPNEKPIALGLLTPDTPVSLVLPANIVAQLSTSAVLAVSVEPPGGSPTGQPTGPVVATGAMHNAV